MLKTLRITSLAAVILAICGVVVIAVFGFRGDPEIKDILETPSITEKFKGLESKADKKESDIHPLVTQAKAFALRINPPPPPPPPAPKNPTPKPTSKPELVRKPVAPPPPPPPPPASFQVLATVQYETEPSRSLALLKSGNTYSWFRQGEKAGHLTLDEVRDGSIVVSQAGRNPQTLYVPVKQESKSLLKGDKTAVASARPSTASMPGAVASTASFVSEGAAAGSASNPAVRPRVLTSRVGRVRAQPPVPTPEEKQAELEQTITGLQEIMNRQDDSIPAEQRQAENQMWMELLNVLKSEKDSLATAAASTKDAEASTESETGSDPAAAAGSTESPEAGEGEQMPAADELAEIPEAPAETEDQAATEGEGEGEVDQADPAPAEQAEEGAAPEEGFAADPGEEAEGFGEIAAESGEVIPAEGEGELPAGFGEAAPGEY